jgi:hypothetical protein
MPKRDSRRCFCDWQILIWTMPNNQWCYMFWICGSMGERPRFCWRNPWSLNDMIEYFIWNWEGNGLVRLWIVIRCFQSVIQDCEPRYFTRRETVFVWIDQIVHHPIDFLRTYGNYASEKLGSESDHSTWRRQTQQNVTKIPCSLNTLCLLSWCHFFFKSGDEGAGIRDPFSVGPNTILRREVEDGTVGGNGVCHWTGQSRLVNPEKVAGCLR